MTAPRGFRTCSFVVPLDDEPAARLVLDRYERLIVQGSIARVGDRLRLELDLSTMPPGDGPAREQMIAEDIQRAVSLHLGAR